MGKRQHQSDKLYVTGNEWSKYYGGHKKSKKNWTSAGCPTTAAAYPFSRSKKHTFRARATSSTRATSCPGS